jgi:hypothetical protein
MLLNILKLAGFDAEAKIAEVKAGLELKAKQATEHLSNTARQYALIAGCFAGAAITALFAVIVGLIALYQWTALNYGPFVGFGVVGGLLVLVTAGLVITAMAVGRSAPNAVTENEASAAVSPLAAPQPLALPKPEPSLHAFATGQAAQSPINTDGVFEPIFALVNRYVQMPATGNPAVDDVLGQLGTTAQGATNEALVRSARLVQTGDRTTMLTVLGSAAFLGWLMAHIGEQQLHKNRA